jgi:glycosyltransferase involved in cell wall biosynthesis
VRASPVTPESGGGPKRSLPDEVRVLAVAASAPLAPGFRVRVLLLRHALALHRVFVEPVTFLTDNEATSFAQPGLRRKLLIASHARVRMWRALRRARFGEAVALIQRAADPFPSLRLERLASAGRRLVWDVDDALWLDATSSAGGHPLAVIKGSARKVRWLARRADHVIVSTATLASFLERYTDRITVVPSLVDTAAYVPRPHSDAHGELVIGWIGSPTTARYLPRLTDVLSAVAEGTDRPVRLLVVGGSPPPTSRIAVEVHPWSLQTELQALERIDIGVMPLPDTPWTKGKAAYKAVVYMAAGIPVVADDVGVARRTISDGGLVVTSSEEWIEGLRELGADVRLRARLGARGRARAEREFSVTRWAPTVAALLRGEDLPPEPTARGEDGP